MIAATFIALQLITLTGPDRQVILLNVDTIATVRTVRGTDHFADGINCLIFTTDGKNINVIETCDQVKRMMEQAK
jgi:hypothetical protein